MKIGPTDRGCFPVVTAAAGRLGVGVDRLKVLSGAQRAEVRKTSSEILVVAGEQNPTAAQSEPPDIFDVGLGQRTHRVGCNEPQLRICARRRLREVLIIARGALDSITSEHLVAEFAARILESAQVCREQREPADVPVVCHGANRRLHQDWYRHWGVSQLQNMYPLYRRS